MESQPQNPENFHPCTWSDLGLLLSIMKYVKSSDRKKNRISIFGKVALT